MELHLQRDPTTDGATLGKLYVNGEFFCFTLEDAIREHKFAGETCIPSGRYKIVINKSQHFQRMLPLLLNVPEFDGIRIHAGNGPVDTHGCILVGLDRHANTIVQSRSAMDLLQPVIATALAKGEDVWITVKNPQVVETLSA